MPCIFARRGGDEVIGEFSVTHSTYTHKASQGVLTPTLSFQQSRASVATELCNCLFMWTLPSSPAILSERKNFLLARLRISFGMLVHQASLCLTVQRRRRAKRGRRLHGVAQSNTTSRAHSIKIRTTPNIALAT